MARIAKSAAATPAASKATGKVAKLDKGAKPAKTAKSAPAADANETAPAPRGQYANRPYTVTEAGKAAAPRGNRGARWAMVKAAKNTGAVLGQPYTRADGEVGTITSSGLRNFVNRGFIAFADE